MSQVVEEALEWYLAERQWLAAEDRRLTAERTRLQTSLAQGGSPALKRQVEDYNRTLAAFNARVARVRRAR
jgi:hypothetical protein